MLSGTEFFFLLMAAKAPPCVERACSSKADAMRKMFEQTGKPAPVATVPATSSGAGPCPPDRDELGRHSWTLLHTLAAYFPDEPTADESKAAVGFVQALGILYPCSHCAADLRYSMAENPPKAGSRAELSAWLCEAHNRVNRALGKSVFSCALADLDERWRTGGKHCDETTLAAEREP